MALPLALVRDGRQQRERRAGEEHHHARSQRSPSRMAGSCGRSEARPRLRRRASRAARFALHRPLPSRDDENHAEEGDGVHENAAPTPAAAMSVAGERRADRARDVELDAVQRGRGRQNVLA